MWRPRALAAALASAVLHGVLEAQGSATRAALQGKDAAGRLTPDMQQIVTTLGEVVEGIEAERTKAKEFSESLGKECDESLEPVKKAVNRRSGIIGGLEQDLEDLNTEAAGLESTINGLKDDIQKSKDKAADLDSRLEKLRESEVKNAQLFEVGVREVDEVISRAGALARRKAAKLQVPSKRPAYSENDQVSSLQQLGRQLSFARSGDGAGPRDDLGGAPESFLQTAAAADGTSRGPEAVLMADKSDVLKAQNSTQTAFEVEERRLQDLVDIEKKRLQVLEASLKDQQPILTEKLKQATETSSLFEMSKRNLLRDRTLLNMTIALSRKISDGQDFMDPKRHEILNLVKMPIKMLESMDMASFLSRDLQHLSAAPALVQVAAKSRAGSRARSKKEESFTAQMALATSEEDGAAAEPADPQDTVESLPQLPAAAALQESSGAAEGPFDKVSEMLQALISALREEANDDAAGEDMRKWCVGAVKVNKKAKVMTQSTIDMLKTEAKWTQTAIDRLSDLVSFLGEEVPRLKAATEAADSMLKKMQAQVEAETKERLLTKDIVQRSIVVLIELCELDDSQLMLMANGTAPVKRRPPPAFVQTKSEALLLTAKGSQCAEAAKTLRDAVSKVMEVNEEHSSYFHEFKSVADDLKDIIAVSTEERSADLTQCKSASAKRASDLAVAQEDLRHKTRDLELLGEEIKELEQSCGPRAETHEERTARRQDEIEALKNALSVLEGESIPVEYSLIETGQSRRLRRR
jgi:uncharacterized protein YoxC